MLFIPVLISKVSNEMRNMHPTPVLFPGKSHGWRSLAGYSPGVLKSRNDADDTTIMSESEKEIKRLLIKVKHSEKTGLKLNIQKMKIMRSSPITS